MHFRRNLCCDGSFIAHGTSLAVELIGTSTSNSFCDHCGLILTHHFSGTCCDFTTSQFRLVFWYIGFGILICHTEIELQGLAKDYFMVHFHSVGMALPNLDAIRSVSSKSCSFGYSSVLSVQGTSCVFDFATHYRWMAYHEVFRPYFVAGADFLCFAMVLNTHDCNPKSFSNSRIIFTIGHRWS